LISGGLFRESDGDRKKSPRVTNTHRIIAPVTPKAAMLFKRVRVECIFLRDVVKEREREEEEEGKREGKKERRKEGKRSKEGKKKEES
jgi:hypothetical protein